MLRRRFRARINSLSGVGSQLGNASDRRVVVQPIVDQEAADDGCCSPFA
jgi:hypothetical protein